MNEPHRVEEPRAEYLYEFAGQFWRGAESLNGYRLYSFEHVDDLSFMRDAAELPREVAERARMEFLGAGWRGDGRLQVAWIPPFASKDITVTQGAFLIHVKQNDNGVSWMLSPIPLPKGDLICTL